MTTELQVLTDFRDIAELAEAYAEFVDEERLMLGSSYPLERETDVSFRVCLADGSVALEGKGRVQQVRDNRTDFPDADPFDIVLDNLVLHGSSQVVFERILIVRSGMSEGRPTGEASVVEEVSDSVVQALPSEPSGLAMLPDGTEDEESVSEPAAQTAEASQTDVWGTEVATSELSVVDERGAPRPEFAAVAQPPRTSITVGIEPQATLSERVPPPALTRFSKPPSWAPEAPSRPSRRPSLGLYEYGTGHLPIPMRVPRPQIDDALRIAPAPRPS